MDAAVGGRGALLQRGRGSPRGFSRSQRVLLWVLGAAALPRQHAVVSSAGGGGDAGGRCQEGYPVPSHPILCYPSLLAASRTSRSGRQDRSPLARAAGERLRPGCGASPRSVRLPGSELWAPTPAARGISLLRAGGPALGGVVARGCPFWALGIVA